jgi:hypothetical protein
MVLSSVVKKVSLKRKIPGAGKAIVHSADVAVDDIADVYLLAATVEVFVGVAQI